MSSYTVNKIQDCMSRPTNIRNMSVVAHVDTGKTTCTDSLLNKAGFISNESTGEKRGTDTRADEQERCITIKSTGISLHYELNDSLVPPGSNGNNFLVNLIDSPGHMDFSSEVTAALRVTDGCLVIVCCVEGIKVQTETVLRQALEEMIKPVLMFNKLDRLIMELQLTGEEIYQRLNSHLKEVNDFISDNNTKMPKILLNPSVGNVTFGCGKMGWGFTLPMIADKWKDKLEVDMTREKFTELLWGENYINPAQGKFYTSPGEGRVRTFVHFALNPIMRVFNVYKEDNEQKISKMLDRMKIKLLSSVKPKDRLKITMQKFMHCADALLEMIILHLPSPIEAQKYRVDHLYSGPKDDEYAEGIRNCDPNGPLVMYVSKLFPSKDLSRFYAFGRVFSGSVTSSKVYIQLPEYTVGDKHNYYYEKIQQVVIMMGDEPKSIQQCPAGNTIALMGIDKFIQKSATITSSLQTHNIRSMVFKVSPVVSAAIKCKSGADLPKLINGLKLLNKSDPLCLVKHDKNTKEIVIYGAGELHLEICLQDLQTMFARGVEIEISPPVVPLSETVIGISDRDCLAKSSSKLNRIYMKASSVKSDLVKELEENSINDNTSIVDRSAFFRKYEWSNDESKKIKGFSNNNTNLLVDSTRAVQYLDKTIDTITSTFRANAEAGPLCGEEMVGVKFDLVDATFHSDNAHRGAGEIAPPTRRSMFASFYTAEPRLMEPIYLAEIQCPTEYIGQVYNVTGMRGGTVIDEIPKGHGLHIIKAYIPVLNSFGYTSELLGSTSGNAFATLVFSHKEIIESDPFIPGTRAYNLVRETRKRKGMNVELPPLSHYLDKL